MQKPFHLVIVAAKPLGEISTVFLAIDLFHIFLDECAKIVVRFWDAMETFFLFDQWVVTETGNGMEWNGIECCIIFRLFPILKN